MMEDWAKATYSPPRPPATSPPGHLLTFTPQKFLLDFPRVTSHMDGKDRGKKWPACRPVEGRKRKKERKKEKKKEGEGGRGWNGT